MKKTLLTLIYTLALCTLAAQNNFSGMYRYFPSDRTLFSIRIEQNGNSISGTHSGVYQGGNRYDGSFDENDITINGSVSGNTATFSIRSGYQATVPGRAEITLLNQDSIRFRLITPPSNGMYFMPKDVIMERVK